MMQENKLRFSEVKRPDPVLMKLLQRADPSREHIQHYLTTGSCFVATCNGWTVGAMVLKEAAPGVMEIMNLAVTEAMEGRGFGKQLLQEAERICRERSYPCVRIGTGNSSISQLALYQKAGYEITAMEKDHFIRHYQDPIYENGIRCRHKIILEKRL